MAIFVAQMTMIVIKQEIGRDRKEKTFSKSLKVGILLYMYP